MTNNFEDLGKIDFMFEMNLGLGYESLDQLGVLMKKKR
jgi:hypothetical protein